MFFLGDFRIYNDCMSFTMFPIFLINRCIGNASLANKITDMADLRRPVNPVNQYQITDDLKEHKGQKVVRGKKNFLPI